MALPTQAANVSIGRIAYGGTGCPAGTASLSSGSIRLTQYKASARSSAVDRASCNLTIPLRVSRGMHVALPTITFTGIARGSARLDSEVFFAGSTGVQNTSQISGSFSARSVGSAWSACGDSVNLRVNSGLLVHAGSSGQIKQMRLGLLKVRPCR